MYVLNKNTIPYIQDVCTFLALSMLELFVTVCYRPMFPKSFRIMSIKQSNYISPVSVKRPECYGPINRMNPIATCNTTTKFNKKGVHLLDILFMIRLSTLTELCVIHAWLMTRINFWYAVIVLIRDECVIMMPPVWLSYGNPFELETIKKMGVTSGLNGTKSQAPVGYEICIYN